MKLPRMWRRKRDGKEFGAFHVYIRNKPINLATQDAEEAKKRRLRAMRGQRNFRDHVQAAGADALAQLGEISNETAQDRDTPATADPGKAPAQPEVPPLPPLDGAAAAEPVIDAEPIPDAERAGDWAADMNSAAGAAPAEGTAGEAPRLRLTDFAWFKGALITASKVAVGLQLHAQAWTMRLVGDVEAGRVGPPPSMQEPDGAESMAAFMRVASAPWDAQDPREPGRQAYERTIVALIPEELPVPAWLKWFEAPVITAMNTAPIQWQTGTKIKPDAPAEGAPAVTEAPPDARAAA